MTSLKFSSPLPGYGTVRAVFGVTAVLLVSNAGLLMVDSIHFQYNGFLTGFLLLSVANVLEERYLLGAFWYIVLVNFKHIYLYLTPAYAAFYLRNYFITERTRTVNIVRLLKSVRLSRVLYLTVIKVLVFGLSFGPFLYFGQIRQVLSRLFPFRRGLTHAYWAPNFWALYNFGDLALFHLLKRLKLISGVTETPGYTSGLVQEYSHAVLPSVSPLCTFLLTVSSMLPLCLIVALSPKKSETFLRLLTFCAFCSFLFGWHVHEKAILLVTVPLILLAVKNYRYAKIFVILSTVGHFSLFPLFFTQFESPIKYLVTLIYAGFAIYGLSSIYRVGSNSHWKLPFLNIPETLFLSGLIPLEFYCNFLHGAMGLDRKAPFLPLMLTSVYCAVGILYCFLHFSWLFLCEEISVDVWICKKIWAKEQNRLKQQLCTKNAKEWQEALVGDNSVGSEKLKYVGGLDISTPDGDDLNACVCLTVLKYPELEVNAISHAFVSVPQAF